MVYATEREENERKDDLLAARGIINAIIPAILIWVMLFGIFFLIFYLVKIFI